MIDKLEQFLAYLKHERHALPNSVRSYKSDLSMMLDHFKERNIELEDVDHKVIRDYLLTLHKRKLRKTSIYKKVSCIKSFFKFCKKRSWIRTDPAKIIEFPKFEKPVPSFLTEKEMERFLPLPILELREYAILELLYATGIRGSELIGIDIETIKELLGHHSIVVTQRYIHSSDERKRKAVEILSKKSDETGLNSDKDSDNRKSVELIH